MQSDIEIQGIIETHYNEYLGKKRQATLLQSPNVYSLGRILNEIVENNKHPC